MPKDVAGGKQPSNKTKPQNLRDMHDGDGTAVPVKRQGDEALPLFQAYHANPFNQKKRSTCLLTSQWVGEANISFSLVDLSFFSSQMVR